MVIKIYRASHLLWRLRVPLLPRLLYATNRILFATVIPPSVKIGRNVLLGYSGLGIVIHKNAVIGNNVKISQNVTIGGRSGHRMVPIIEDDVEIGAGACVIGPIHVGQGAKIGANAVVLNNVPRKTVAVGIPARILK